MYKGLRLGATGRTRTDDLLITNELLYQLSHGSICDRVQPMYGRIRTFKYYNII